MMLGHQLGRVIGCVWEGCLDRAPLALAVAGVAKDLFAPLLLLLALPLDLVLLSHFQYGWWMRLHPLLDFVSSSSGFGAARSCHLC